MDDLRATIARAISSARTPDADLYGSCDPHAFPQNASEMADAVLAAIRATHAVIEKERWKRVQSAVRQGLRLQSILHDRFGYIDEYGIPLAPGDLARDAPEGDSTP